MELTILGSAGSYPGPGRLCSGYLVRTAATALLLDAGNGSTANLQRHVALTDLDAAVISHRHLDHCADLVGVYYALRFGTDGARLRVLAAVEVADALAAIMAREGAHELADVYDFEEVAGGDTRQVGDLTLRFADAVHLTPAVSVRVEAAGRSLVYSGDSAGGPALVELARGADLLLCEATWVGDTAERQPGIHLTGRGAGEIARDAGVGRLVLTHVAGGIDRDQVLAEARAVYDGPTELADDGGQYDV